MAEDKKLFFLKVAVSAASLLLLVAYQFWPNLKMDVYVLALLGAAILPWLASIFERIELPGGIKVTYASLKSAGEKALQGKDPSEVEGEKSATLDSLRGIDPAAALVWLRIEIEKRVRELGEMGDVDEKQSLARMTKQLQHLALLTPPTWNALQEIIYAGNQAAHGARVEPAVADWAVTVGPAILAELDTQIAAYREFRSQKHSTAPTK